MRSWVFKENATLPYRVAFYSILFYFYFSFFSKNIMRTFFRKKRVGGRKKKMVLRKAISSKSKVQNKKLTNIVKSIIHKQSETKQAFLTTGNSLTMFNSGVNTTADMLQVLPNITASVNDNGRIGDQIRAQRLNVRGYIKLNTNSVFNSGTLPAVVARLMVVTLKSKPNYTEATSSATPLGGLLKIGGSTTGFNGNLQQIYAPINTDLWTVHVDKKFYLNQTYLLQPGGASATAQPVDVKNTVKFFNFNIRCKNRLLKYDSNVSSGLLPTNFGPIMLLGYSYLDGTTPDVVSTNLGLQFDTIFDYEDA